MDLLTNGDPGSGLEKSPAIVTGAEANTSSTPPVENLSGGSSANQQVEDLHIASNLDSFLW